MSTQTSASPGLDPAITKLRRDKSSGAFKDHNLLAILGIFSALMLGISLSILSVESGPMANLKVLLITCSAGLVAYAVNRFCR